MDKATRTWNIVVPNATGGHWYFTFHVDFEQTSKDRVWVRWTELCIGCGTFRLNHFGVCWGCLFEAYKKLERLAEDHAYDWNLIDAKNG